MKKHFPSLRSVIWILCKSRPSAFTCLRSHYSMSLSPDGGSIEPSPQLYVYSRISFPRHLPSRPFSLLFPLLEPNQSVRLGPPGQGPVVHAVPPAPQPRADGAPAHLRVPVPVLPADYREVVEDALREGHHDLREGRPVCVSQPA